MSKSVWSAGAIAAAIALAVVGSAHGQTTRNAQPSLTLTANDFDSHAYSYGPSVSGRTLEWDSRKGRWGLKVGVEQHVDQLGVWRDVQPGVYYRLTPRLHIGGAVSLAPSQVFNPNVVQPQANNPRVRLETTFKF